MMRSPNWKPSVVPDSADQTVYLVVDDFNADGRIFRETSVEAADLETVIADLMSGQYRDPVRVVVFTPRSTGRRRLEGRRARNPAPWPISRSRIYLVIEALSKVYSGRDGNWPLRLV